jgi:type VI secretion system protein ImpM
VSGAGAVGLYGKVGSQPDFLRAGAGAFCQSGLDRWLQEGVEALRTERTQLPEEPTAFLLAPGGSPAFVGVLAPSRDSAGRSFPLALFAELPVAAAHEGLPSLPERCASFLADASGLVARAADLDGADLSRRTQALEARLSDTPEPHAWKNEPVRTLAAMFDGALPAAAFALNTLATACDRATAGTDPATATLTVDAPVGGSATAALWLEIARRRLGAAQAVPSLLWTKGPEARLLLTLGPPSPMALAFLANPRHRSSRLWPLRTTVASAMDQAWAALSPRQRSVLEAPDAALGDLSAEFT